MKLILLGAPGAGKGTQSARISEKYGIPAIATGDILRAAIKEGTELGKSAKSYIDAGKLVPDEVVIGIIRDKLNSDACRNGFILDGFPRTVEQAKALSTFAKIDVAINLDVPDDVLVKRLSGRRVCPLCGAPYHVDRLNGETVCRADGTPLIQRDDDKAETVLNRLAVYHRETEPLKDFYRERGVLYPVEDMGPVEATSKAILAILRQDG